MEPASMRQAYTSRPDPWLEGVAGIPVPHSAANDTGVLALVLAVFVLVGFNMRHVARLMRQLPGDLWSVRRRNNAFDDHTANETRTTLLLVLQLCVFEAVLMWVFQGQGPQPFRSVGLLALLMGAWYGFSLVAYATVGYVFTDRQGSSLWLRGFNASQVMLSGLLLVPAMVALFYASFAGAMLWAAAALYLFARGAFIIKGFRIFYLNLSSSLYFILYLCTLEIIPVIAIFVLATEICAMPY